MADTRHQRVYLVRLALGDGVKNPLPLADFAALIKKRRRVAYDPSTLSRMENGTRKVTIEDIEAIAPLDPKRRGKVWLAAWDDELTTRGHADPVTLEPTPMADALAELAQDADTKEAPPKGGQQKHGKRGTRSA